jgi:TetR/AcrR family transcriptional regulator, transcriptional repressor for nem operon
VTAHPTKIHILDTARELMLRKSYHSVGLSEILAAADIPKGSFYHHFSSKEDFGVALLHRYVEEITAIRQRLLLTTETAESPLLRLFLLFEAAISIFEKAGGKCPCLAIKLAAEVADFSDPMREELARSDREWIAINERLLQEALESGHARPGTDPATMAALIHDLWAGAMQRASVARDAAPLWGAIRYLRQVLIS